MENYNVSGKEEKWRPLKIHVEGQFCDMTIDLTRIDKNLKRAQTALDIAVMTGMEGFMPRQTGQFIQLTKARSAAIAGSGYVVAGAPPFGRFLYYGKVMVDPETRSAWARKGVKKVVTDKPLKFWYPLARPKWFEVAKKTYLPSWLNTVRNALNGRA